jgi:hypothetical protein
MKIWALAQQSVEAPTIRQGATWNIDESTGDPWKIQN